MIRIYLETINFRQLVALRDVVKRDVLILSATEHYSPPIAANCQ